MVPKKNPRGKVRRPATYRVPPHTRGAEAIAPGSVSYAFMGIRAFAAKLLGLFRGRVLHDVWVGVSVHEQPLRPVRARRESLALAEIAWTILRVVLLAAVDQDHLKQRLKTILQFLCFGEET